jgi:hypothetical protein
MDFLLDLDLDTGRILGCPTRPDLIGQPAGEFFEQEGWQYFMPIEDSDMGTPYPGHAIGLVFEERGLRWARDRLKMVDEFRRSRFLNPRSLYRPSVFHAGDVDALDSENRLFAITICPFPGFGRVVANEPEEAT